MKKRFMSVLTIGLVLATILSMLTVNAAGKLSEVDFSKWEEVKGLTIDFEDKAKDSDYGAPPAEWAYEHAAGDKGKVVEVDGKKYLDAKGFCQLFLREAIAESIYVFSADIKCPLNQNVGIFARAGKERFTYEANKSDYYEQDRSEKIEELQNLGGSGFYIRPAGDKVKLYIKLFDDSKTCDIDNKMYEISAGADFSTGFHKLTYIDNGSVVSIYVDDNLIATIAFSESKKYSIGNEDYYSKVVVKAADGTKLGEHDNALFAVKSVVAFGNRNNNFMVDNIKLTTYKATNPATDDALMPVIYSLIFTVVLVVVICKKRVNA